MDNSLYKVIFVLGNPGSGKNTQCDLIKEHFKFHHFGCGDLLRAEASREGSDKAELINDCIKNGKIVPSEVTCQLAKNEMERQGKNNIFLIDGFPRNLENLQGWDNVFKEECKVLAVLHLDCSQETCIKRIKFRSQNSGRLDDNDESLKKRFTVFDEETTFSLKKLSERTTVLIINSDKNDKSEVFNEIKEKLDKLLDSK